MRSRKRLIGRFAGPGPSHAFGVAQMVAGGGEEKAADQPGLHRIPFWACSDSERLGKRRAAGFGRAAVTDACTAGGRDKKSPGRKPG
jgi:hypothetical protein